jgi:hypothetical protein
VDHLELEVGGGIGGRGSFHAEVTQGGSTYTTRNGSNTVVNGGGEVRIAARSEFPPSRDISLRNLTVSNTNIRWSPCTGTNNTITNVTRINSSLTWC